MSFSDDVLLDNYDNLLKEATDDRPITPLDDNSTELRLLKNTQFRYELALAYREIDGLTGRKPEFQLDFEVVCSRHDKVLNEMLLRRLAYFNTVDGHKTAYSQMIDAYNITRHPNQYLTHWFYPYKGKYHPQLVRALLNILRVRPGETVLDPFNGSGTTALECMLLGINAIGRDVSPVCVKVTQAKTDAWQYVEEIETLAPRLLTASIIGSTSVPLSLFTKQEDGSYETLLDEIKTEPIRNFFVVAQLIAESDSARRSRQIIASLQRQVPRMIKSLRYMKEAIKSLDLTLGNIDVQLGDARKLDLDKESIDHIITSPPYSIMLNYVENDRHALEALGCDVNALQENFIGVRGKGQAKLEEYKKDMLQSVNEMARVLKPGGKCVIVVGNPTSQGKPIPVIDDIQIFAKESGLQWEATLPKYVLGFYNTLQVEDILIFSKPGIRSGGIL